MNKAEEWLRSKKYTPDLIFSWEWVVRELEEYAQSHQVEMPKYKDIEKQLLDRFGFTEDGVDAEN